MAGVAAGDMAAVLAASAIAEPATGVDLESYLELIKFYSPTSAPGPGQHSLFAAANSAWNKRMISGSAVLLAYGLHGSEPVTVAPQPALTSDRLEAFIDSIDPGRLGDLSLLSIGIPIGLANATAEATAYRRQAAATLGATDATGRDALIEAGGRDRSVRFELLRYPGGWKVQSEFTLEDPITQDEFQALVVEATDEGELPDVPVLPNPAAVSGPGFASPEDAVRALTAAIASGDPVAVMAASATDLVTEHYDFAAAGDYFNTFDALQNPPTDYPYYSEAFRASQEGRVLAQVRFFAYSLLSDEPLNDPIGIAGITADRAHEIAQSLDPTRLQALEILKTGTPAELAPSLSQPGYLGVYGADEVTERLALLSFEGRTYWKGFALIRYGERWWVQQIGALSADDLRGLGAARPTTETEFDALIQGD